MEMKLDNLIFVLSLYAIVSVVCWAWVGIIAGVAIFSVHINDTLSERFGLAWVSIGCFAAAWRIVEYGQVSDTVLFVSLGFAFYVTSIFLKCWRCVNFKHVSGLPLHKR